MFHNHFRTLKACNIHVRPRARIPVLVLPPSGSYFFTITTTIITIDREVTPS